MTSTSKPSELAEEDLDRGSFFEEEGFYSPTREEAEASAQTWFPFEDLDDSGHFTSSPDGERAVGLPSSGSHSPCPSSAHLLLQMKHLENKSLVVDPPQYQQQQRQQCQTLQAQVGPAQHKPLISPRSVMTVKVPQSSGLASMASDTHGDGWQTSPPFRPETYTVESDQHKSEPLSPRSGPTIKPPLLPMSFARGMGSGGDASQVQDGKQSDESCEYLRSILVNFNSLYMEKLRMIDDLVTEGSEEQKNLLMEKKTNMLENWAKDVCVHNMVLVHTVEELEREANRKVAALQKKMTESTQLAKEHMTMIKKYEEQVRLLLKNHNDTEEKNLVLKIELEKLKSECRRVRDRMNLLLKDNESLLTLVCLIRDMGVWDLSGLELQRSSFDQIFGLYPNLAGGEVQTVFTREKARQVKETEQQVVELEKQLDELHSYKKEAETSAIQKDRKIEELEMEIKNVLNKAHYCEKECNDYKQSLLETQEKLLEATRRLTQSTMKNVPAKDPGESEMTELLRELRDVKSQLNTAVGEKESAKEESSYFKRELSDRLKEMHDVQSVFQNLATEVVSSRAAFQQVQEKEVQLQSLKSEIQTYQSRCANAEDTIRQKELEIKRLQKQINEIHKRASNIILITAKKREPAPKTPPVSIHSREGSGSILTSEKQSSLKLTQIPLIRNKPKQKTPRNMFHPPSRIPVHIKQSLQQQQYQSTSGSVVSLGLGQTWAKKGGRPPWNTHFKKTTDILSLPPPALPAVAKIQTAQIKSSLQKTEAGLENMGNDCQHIYDKLTDLERQMNLRTASPKSVSIQKSASNSTLGQKNKSVELPRLPKIASEHFNRHMKHSTKSAAPPPEESPLKNEKLPILQGTHTSPNTKPTKIPLKRLVPDPRAPTPRLNELITAVVETSKKLLDQSSSSRGGGRKFTVTAAHYRRRRSSKEQRGLRRTRSSEKHTQGEGDSDAPTTPNTAKKFHSTTEITKGKEESGNENYNEAEPEPEVSEAEADQGYDSSTNVKEYLSKLPEDSFEDIVKSWIHKSSSTSLQEDMKKPKKMSKSMPVRGRQSSVRVMKHLATRRCPRELSTKSNKSTDNESTDGLEHEMFELEEEWGKVFANIEGNKTSAPEDSPEAGATQVDKPCGPIITDSSKPLQQPCSVETSSPESHPSHPSEQSSETKCQESASVQELLSRLTREKEEMEQRYRKELEEKNVELKMQKVTIQHLQDAYVALKRGQPIPLPQTVTGNKIIIANGSSNSNGSNGHHHKTNHNNNNNNNHSQILDV